ncbi:DUF3231 family protein [Paenibacillus sp. YYML68]|uniref:DUF3231 family protein n=1 Tax=Paenibacillus sp. YYML68 TaxID=2909250 RepID=UPI002490BE29|nr:DUF3231 family protein [Paenibacillus sp. YYML68]
MGILDGNSKNEPMHYGEIHSIWSYSAKAKLAVTCYQTMINHAGDQDLKEVIRDIIEMGRKEIEECDAILVKNGIVPPPTFPEKPRASYEEIPVGARFTDMEIAATLMQDVAEGLATCSQAMGQCTREDLGTMFMKYHGTKAVLSARVLRMNKAKGWLVPPPLQLQVPELVHS